MNTSTIAFFSLDNDQVKSYFHELFADAKQFEKEVQDYKPEDIQNREQIEIVSSFTGSVWNQEHLSWFPNLKMIAARSTGYDNIDLAYCKEKGIVVCNVPVYGANTVAEFAFALLLAISRKAFQSDILVDGDHSFIKRGTEEIKGFDLQGKTIGIIGAGNIGRNAISIANGFGMKIIVCDPHKNDELVSKYGLTWTTDIKELVSLSDVISIHVPYFPATHHLINTELKPFVKKGAVIINTSRGEIIDTAALLEMLDEGIVSAAGLDVLEDESKLGKEESRDDSIQKLNQELIKRKNVIVTPHNAFNTQEAIHRIWEVTAQNIQMLGEGKAQNVVPL